MKKGLFLGICVVAMATVLFTASGVLADDLVGTSPGHGWQSWSATNLDNSGNFYWDHGPSDGGSTNVGNWMTNTGHTAAFLGTHGPGNLPFWAANGGAADATFYFNSTSSSGQAAMQIEIAGNAGTNVFGWYDVITGAKTQIFSGADTAGTTKPFTPTAEYGFYLDTTTANQGIFYTQSTLNAIDQQSDQHFAVFNDSNGTGGTYWLGMEDLAFTTSDKDYNDMIVKITPVPEPFTLLFLGACLVGTGLISRKFKI
jgi:hypothetical protein